jgi:hypothetical protein
MLLYDGQENGPGEGHGPGGSHGPGDGNGPENGPGEGHCPTVNFSYREKKGSCFVYNFTS